MKAPEYAKIGGIAMQLQRDGKYYRHAGNYLIEVKEIDGKLFADTEMGNFKDAEVVEITHEQWMIANKGYITISETLNIQDECIAEVLNYFERHSTCVPLEKQTPFEKVFLIMEKKMLLVIQEGTFIVKHAIIENDEVEFGISILRMPINFFASCTPILHSKIQAYVNGTIEAN